MMTLLFVVEGSVTIIGMDRSSAIVASLISLGGILLQVAIVAGFFLYPNAWRLFQRCKHGMSPEVRHLWLAILIFLPPAAGYAAQHYLAQRIGPLDKWTP